MTEEAENSAIKFSLDARPLYVRVEETMAEFIKGYTPGQKLPPEAELAQKLGISRATLREVLRAFEERGLIVSKRGVGNFVTGYQPIMESGLEVLESLDSIASRYGLQISMDNLTISRRLADSSIAEKMEIPERTPLFVVTRNRIKDGIVLACMYDFIPTSLTTQEILRDKFSGSMIDFLNFHTHAKPSWATTFMHSLNATTELSKRMKIPRGTALLLLEEKLYSSENKVINYSRNYYITSHFLFHIIRRRL